MKTLHSIPNEIVIPPFTFTEHVRNALGDLQDLHYRRLLFFRFQDGWAVAHAERTEGPNWGWMQSVGTDYNRYRPYYVPNQLHMRITNETIVPERLERDENGYYAFGEYFDRAHRITDPGA